MTRDRYGVANKAQQPLNLRWLQRAALLTIALTLLAGCMKVPLPLRVATHPWPGYESLHLAQSLDYFDKAQVRLVELSNASQTVQALRNGTVDAAVQTLDEVIGLIEEGVALRVVLIMDVSHGADVLLARPGIKSLQDLRGKRVGVETTTTGAVVFDGILTAAHLSVADIQVIPLSMNEHVTAYQQGKVDALVTYDPPRSQLLAQGARTLFDSSRIPNRIVDVLAVRVEALASHPQALTTLVAAHFKALDYLARQPRDAAVRLAPFMGVSADQVLPQFAGLLLPDVAENRAQLSGPTPGLARTASELAALMHRQHLLQSIVAVDHVAEPMFLPRAAP